MDSLRGKAGFLSQTTFGRAGRAPEGAMVAFSQTKGVGRKATIAAPETLLNALRLLKALILRAPPRKLYLQPRYRAPTIIYTDASLELKEDPPCRMGAVIFSERLQRPKGYTAVLPNSALSALKIRKQQITPCETLVTSIIITYCPECLQDVDCIWFIDNQGSEAGLISGYSSEPDAGPILGTVHILLAALNSRCWWEFVPSERSPSDGLSRAGLDDEWTLKQGWDLKEVTLPDWSDLENLPLDSLLETFAENAARLPEADIRQAPVSWKVASAEITKEQAAQRALADRASLTTEHIVLVP
jgi:hypothetical protein